MATETIRAHLTVHPRFGGPLLLEEDFECVIPVTRDINTKLFRAKLQYRQSLQSRMENPQDPAHVLKGRELVFGGHVIT